MGAEWQQCFTELKGRKPGWAKACLDRHLDLLSLSFLHIMVPCDTVRLVPREEMLLSSTRIVLFTADPAGEMRLFA